MDLANLALVYPHCNARKWAYIEGEDLESGQMVALCNPRTQRKWQSSFDNARYSSSGPRCNTLPYTRMSCSSGGGMSSVTFT